MTSMGEEEDVAVILRLGNELKCELHLKDEFSHFPDISEACLFLGSKKVAENQSTLKNLAIRAIVNCAPHQVESPLESVDGFFYFNCNGLEDSLSFDPQLNTFSHSNVSPFFVPVYSFVKKHLLQGRNVLIHCAGGVSRSATLCLAVLLQMSRVDVTLRDLYTYVQERRGVIAPNATFVNQLIDLEQRTRGRETVKRPTSLHQRGVIFHPLDSENFI